MPLWDLVPNPSTPHLSVTHPIPAIATFPRSHVLLQTSPQCSSAALLKLSPTPCPLLPTNPILNLYSAGLPNSSAHPGVHPGSPSPPAALLPPWHPSCRDWLLGTSTPAGDEEGFTLGCSGSGTHIRKPWARGQNQQLQTREDLRK